MVACIKEREEEGRGAISSQSTNNNKQQTQQQQVLNRQQRLAVCFLLHAFFISLFASSHFPVSFPRPLFVTYISLHPMHNVRKRRMVKIPTTYFTCYNSHIHFLFSFTTFHPVHSHILAAPIATLIFCLCPCVLCAIFRLDVKLHCHQCEHAYHLVAYCSDGEKDPNVSLFFVQNMLKKKMPDRRSRMGACWKVVMILLSLVENRTSCVRLHSEGSNGNVCVV